VSDIDLPRERQVDVILTAVALLESAVTRDRDGVSRTDETDALLARAWSDVEFGLLVTTLINCWVQVARQSPDDATRLLSEIRAGALRRL
jgi:hypothetical protein